MQIRATEKWAKFYFSQTNKKKRWTFGHNLYKVKFGRKHWMCRNSDNNHRHTIINATITIQWRFILFDIIGSLARLFYFDAELAVSVYVCLTWFVCFVCVPTWMLTRTLQSKMTNKRKWEQTKWMNNGTVLFWLAKLFSNQVSKCSGPGSSIQESNKYFAISWQLKFETNRKWTWIPY